MDLSRRQLVQGLARTGLGISLLGLSACGAAPSTLSIRILKQSLPGSLLGQYRRQVPLPVGFEQVDDRQQLFRQLQAQVDPPQTSGWNPSSWLRSAPSTAVISLLGADWLTRARAEDLILPFTDEEVEPIWTRLPRRWRWAARGSDGQIWGLPWRWGLTAIAYHQQWISTPIQDWADLWRPELRGKLTLPDHPREVIGLTLKRLGRSYDSRLRETDPELSQALGQLHRQVLIYTSNHYLPMLRTEDAWVSVGWTEDLFPLQYNFPAVQVVLPRSGSAVWWDLWVKPQAGDLTESEQAEVIPLWLEQVLDPELTARIVDISQIASVLPVDPQQLSRRLQERGDLEPQIWQRAEIWEPLSQEQAQLYLQWWRRMRSGELG